MTPTLIDASGGLLADAGGGPRLVGCRCSECATVTFPRQGSCPRCTSEDVAELLLEPRGTLWTWTVQTFAPPPPAYRGDKESFEPFGVGYVELHGQVRVESRLTEADPDRLGIGMEMELRIVPVPGREADGAVTFAFAPVSHERSGTEW
jgi:uncharacterized protein